MLFINVAYKLLDCCNLLLLSTWPLTMIVCTPFSPFSFLFKLLTKFLKNEGFTGSQFLEEDYKERGSEPFQEGSVFT